MQHLRAFAFLTSLLLLASTASAQLIHSAVLHRVVRPSIHSKTSDHTLSSPLPFTISTGDTNWTQVNSMTTYTFDIPVANSSKDSLTIYFSRKQQLPTGWQTSLCWGSAQCYAPITDSAAVTLPSKGLVSLSLNFDPVLNDVSDTATVWLRMGVAGMPADTQSFGFFVAFLPSDPPLVFDWPNGLTQTTSFSDTGTISLTNWIENDLGTSSDYTFSFADSLPAGWTIQHCVDNTCSSGESVKSSFDPYSSGSWQQKVNFSLHVPTLATTDSAIVYLTVRPNTSNPADSARYRFSFVGQSSNASVSSNSESAGIAVTNAWPNPLHPGSPLHLEVMTDKSGPTSALFYDLDGTLKATLALGQLNMGSNDAQLSLPDGLASGEYILRITEGSSASEFVRINYVK